MALGSRAQRVPFRAPGTCLRVMGLWERPYLMIPSETLLKGCAARPAPNADAFSRVTIDAGSLIWRCRHERQETGVAGGVVLGVVLMAAVPAFGASPGAVEPGDSSPSLTQGEAVARGLWSGSNQFGSLQMWSVASGESAVASSGQVGASLQACRRHSRTPCTWYLQASAAIPCNSPYRAHQRKSPTLRQLYSAPAFRRWLYRERFRQTGRMCF